MTKNSTKREELKQRLNISYEYPVIFCHDIFAPDNQILADLLSSSDKNIRANIIVWFDNGLAVAQPSLIKKARAWFNNQQNLNLKDISIYPGGEQVKDGFKYVEQMIAALKKNKICRKSFVIAVGGGAFLDATGLAAALFHRGVRLLRLPSTVLSQNDSGVGVKNGINFSNVKNLLGVFAPPYAVVNDYDMLKSLPLFIMRDGLAEAFKVAIIKDPDFLDFLLKNADALKMGDAKALEFAIKQSATLHFNHIAQGGDPFENGDARPLDFGHWAAHYLESMSGYELRHGQAVAIGVALDSAYAFYKGLINKNELDSIINGLERSGLSTWHELLDKKEGSRPYVLNGIEEFREHLGGKLAITLPDGIGSKIEVDAVNEDIMIKSIYYLRDR